MVTRVPRKPGWVDGSVDELLELEPWEAELIELRLILADAVREKRSRQGLSQKEVADRLGSTQPRVVRREQAEASLDFILRAVFTLGANRDEVGRILARGSKPDRRRRTASHAKRAVVKRPKKTVRRSA